MEKPREEAPTEVGKKLLLGSIIFFPFFFLRA